MTDTTDAAAKPQTPILTVVKGNPTDQQVAALTVLFAGMAQAAANAAANEQADRNLWGNVADRLSRPVIYNPTAFQNVSFY